MVGRDTEQEEEVKKYGKGEVDRQEEKPSESLGSFGSAVTMDTEADVLLGLSCCVRCHTCISPSIL